MGSRLWRYGESRRCSRVIRWRAEAGAPREIKGTSMRALAGFALIAVAQLSGAAQNAPPSAAQAVIVLRPARVFDGDTVHDGWGVRVRGPRIEAVGPAEGVGAPGATIVDLPGTTLLPGLVEGHSHLLLHPY